MVGAATAIGAAASLASSLIGAIGSANANRKRDALIDTQRKENKRWYETKSAEDYTSRSDVQAVLKKQREILDEYSNRARAVNAVAGGTNEQIAAQQAQVNKTIADTTADIAARSAAYKDSIEQQYRQQDAALNQQQAAMYGQQGATIAQAAGQGVSAGLNLVGAGLEDTTTKKVKELESALDAEEK